MRIFMLAIFYLKTVGFFNQLEGKLLDIRIKNFFLKASSKLMFKEKTLYDIRII